MRQKLKIACNSFSLLGEVSMQNRKTIGIVLTAIYNAIGGLLFALGGVLLMLAAGLPETPAWAPLLGFIFLLLGCLFLAAVYGLWSLQILGIKLNILALHHCNSIRTPYVTTKRIE
jgi:hypothetical protein